jgi:hypothetical protein
MSLLNLALEHLYGKEAFVPAPHMVEALQAQQQAPAQPQEAAGMDPQQMAALQQQMMQQQGVPTEPPPAQAPAAPPPPAADATMQPAPVAQDTTVLTPESLRSIMREVIAEQTAQGGKGGKGGDKDAIIKNMAVDLHHLKQHVTQMSTYLGLPVNTTDPNRDPATGLPAAQTPAAAAPAPQPQPKAAAAPQDYLNVGGGVARTASDPDTAASQPWDSLTVSQLLTDLYNRKL